MLIEGYSFMAQYRSPLPRQPASAAVLIVGRQGTPEGRAPLAYLRATVPSQDVQQEVGTLEQNPSRGRQCRGDLLHP